MTWELDTAHAEVGFSAKHMMITTVRGRFTDVAAEVHIDEQHPEQSHVSATIQAASLDTGDAQRDAHLKSPDFFDVEQYPTITFTSTEVAREDEGTCQITGDLTIKGVTKPVTIEFESTGSARDPFGNLRVGFEGATSINRKDWGLSWNAALETGGVLVSEKIKLEFDVSAIKNA